tara:strand:+ start:1052 stop:1474 length:423 start_codon:yes stop_codon:yes gene_type:complete
MSLTLEELASILAGPGGLDTEKDPATGVPAKLGDLLAKANGVDEEKLLEDLAPNVQPDGKPDGESADLSDVIVPKKYGKREPGDLVRPLIREEKTAGDIVNEAKTPQLVLATLIDAYIRLVIAEELGGSSESEDPSATSA